jgi:hypothetical protein
MAEYYDRGQLLMGGAPVADLESGSVEISNGFQDVVTIGKGWAGGSKGPVMGTLTAKRAVPRAGFGGAQDLHQAVIKSKFVQAMCITGGKKYVVTGVYKGLRRDFGVNATAMEDFALTGSVEVSDL